MKALLQYLVLVGIPVLGVLGILELGQGLTAPRAVSGIWQITPKASTSLACPTPAEVMKKPTLVVEQSGPRLVFEVGNLTIHGLIEGRTVQAESERMNMAAQLEASGVLRGTLSFPSCPATPSIVFSALSEEAS